MKHSSLQQSATALLAGCGESQQSSPQQKLNPCYTMNPFGKIGVFSISLLAYAYCLSAQNYTSAQVKLANDAQEILVNHCGKCHGKGGSYSDKMLLDHRSMIDEQEVLVPGKPETSDIYLAIAEGDMPPEETKNPVPPAKLAIIKKWIEAGAPDWKLAPQGLHGSRQFIETSTTIERIVNDIKKLHNRDRQYVRYYTLTHLYNAGESDDAIQNYRIALSKLVNSLSWEKKITNPIIIDKQETVLRLDLRDYGWDKQIWKTITANYPYAFNYPDKNYATLCRLSAAQIPFIRTDWFISAAALPPLYHEILELPGTDKELEDQLKVNVARNLSTSPGRRVWRSGFLKSGVSKFNRVVERHTSRYGAYWKSYDFDSNKGKKNIFQNPLDFEQAGGEIIFNLPNGLQGYLLVDKNGNRIDEGPVNIVFNRLGSDPIIRNGLTCMACHTSGMKDFNDRADELRLAIQKTEIPPYQKDYALALYTESKTINKLVDADKNTFKRAIEKLNAVVGGKEPIDFLSAGYDKPLKSKMAAAEVGLKESDFINELNDNELLKRKGLNSLAAGGTIARDAWEELFQLVVDELIGKTSSLSFQQNKGPAQVSSFADNSNYKYLNPSLPKSGKRRVAKAYFDDAVTAQKSEEWQRAKAAYLEATKADPVWFDARFELGQAAYYTGDTDLALQSFEHALSIEPNHGPARFNFAMSLVQGNYYAAAARELETFLQFHPDNVYAHFEAGKLYSEKINDVARANVHYKRVISLQPDHPAAVAIRYWLIHNKAPISAPSTVTKLPQPPPRIVTREGTIKRRFFRSPKAPSRYELIDDNGRTISYLYSSDSSFEKTMVRVRDRQVTLTGVESVDPRWPTAPLIDVRSLDTVP